MRYKHITMVFAAVYQFGAAGNAIASDTISYRYDALGRLTTVQHNGGPADGTLANYAFDPTGNRTNVTVTGAWLDAVGRPIVVTPLAGGKLIALPAN